MPVTYGGVEERASSEERIEDEDEIMASIVKGGGKATLLSSTVNITNTIIGSGALAFPHAFASMGLFPGIISCLFSASTAAFGLYLLSRCAAQVPIERRRQTSFNEVAKLTFGKGWATRGFDAAIAIKCFGVSISYLIIIKTLVPQVLISVSRALHHHPDPTSILLNGSFWLLLCMGFIAPLSFFRKLDSLRFTSQIALAAVAYLVAIVVGWWAFKGVSPDRGEVVFARFGRSTLASFPVQVFAYTCAQNLFPMLNELKDNSQKRLNVVIGSSLGASAVTYEILGIIGYLTFGSNVGSNVIAMYPATSYLVAVGQLGIALFVGLSYPLQLLPCRQCIHTLTSGLWVKPHVPNKDDDENEALVGESSDPADEGAGEMSPVKYYGVTASILVCGTVVALLVDDLGVVMSFVGSTGSTIISFILPGLFYFSLFRTEPGPTKWWALALAIYGVAVMCFCLSFNILQLSRARI